MNCPQGGAGLLLVLWGQSWDRGRDNHGGTRGCPGRSGFAPVPALGPPGGHIPRMEPSPEGSGLCGGSGREDNVTFPPDRWRFGFGSY